MKLNKLLIITFFLLAFLAGCSKNDSTDDDKIPDKKEASEDQPYGKYSVNGKLVKIDEEGFHLQTGENVDVYNVDTGRSSNFFIGEYIALTSENGDIYQAAVDENYDYSGITENLFDQAAKIHVKVAEISRDERGAMRIYGLAADNKEYDIVAGAETQTNFARSTLKVGNEILVFSQNISGDIPAFVEARAILKGAD